MAQACVIWPCCNFLRVTRFGWYLNSTIIVYDKGVVVSGGICPVRTCHVTSASYLDLLLSIESDGQLRTFLYDKRDDFNFHITNFPFLSSNIPFSPAYGVFISQLIRYARVCSSYECFILRAARLSSKLLGQGYVVGRLKSSLRKFYGRYGDLIKHAVSLSQILDNILGHYHIQWHPQLIRYHTSLRPYYRTWLYYRFWPYYQILKVSIEHCNGCG